MRIALDIRTVQDHFPGIARYAFNLALAMADAAPHDELLLLHDPSQHNTRFDMGPLRARPNVRFIQVKASPFALSAQWQIPNVLRAQRADVYHSPYYIMPYLVRRPAVVTVHDLIPLLYPQYFTFPQRVVFGLAMRMAVRAARQVIADSQATARDLARHLHVPATKLAVIGVAADPAMRPATAERIADLRARYQLPSEFLLYLGSNKPHKNLVRLVQAYASLAPEARAALVIAGHWDESHPDARQVAERLELSTVRWLGPVPQADLPALYSAALAFAFPSEYEGFGLPVLEAMACGAPVVCSQASSLAEVAGDAALLFDPRDVAALAKCLSRVLTDAPLRDDLRARGFERARAFNWQQIARRTREVYARVATGRPPGSFGT